MATIKNLEATITVDPVKMRETQRLAQEVSDTMADSTKTYTDAEEALTAFGETARLALLPYQQFIDDNEIGFSAKDQFYHVGEEFALMTIKGTEVNYNFENLRYMYTLMDVARQPTWKYQLTLGLILVILLLLVAVMSG